MPEGYNTVQDQPGKTEEPKEEKEPIESRDPSELLESRDPTDLIECHDPTEISESVREEDEENEEDMDDDSGYPITSDIPGYPDWRRVELEDGTVYFFNRVTRETSWDSPDGSDVTQETSVAVAVDGN